MKSNQICPECGGKIPKGCMKWINGKNHCSQRCWNRVKEVESLKRRKKELRFRNSWMNKLIILKPRKC